MSWFSILWLGWVLIFIGLASPVVAQPEPPLVGDWRVDGLVKVENKTVEVRGNVVIAGGGTLQLVSSQLILHALATAEPIVQVEPGGRLILNGTPERRSSITDGPLDPEERRSPDTDLHYRVIVEEGAAFSGRHCLVSDAGVNDVQDPANSKGVQGGILVEGTLRLEDCELFEVKNGIQSEAGHVSLTRVFTKSNQPAGSNVDRIDLFATKGAVDVDNSTLSGMMQLTDVASLRIVDSALRRSATGFAINAFNGAQQTAAMRNVTFEGYDTCLSFGPSTELRLHALVATGCAQAIELLQNSNAHVTVEGFEIRNSRAVGSAGAVSVFDASLFLENGSLAGGAGREVYVGKGGVVALRNVRVADAGVAVTEGGEVQTHGLLKVSLNGAGTRASSFALQVDDQRGREFRSQFNDRGFSSLWLPDRRLNADGWSKECLGWTVSIEGESHQYAERLDCFDEEQTLSVLVDKAGRISPEKTLDPEPAPAIPFVNVLLGLASVPWLGRRVHNHLTLAKGLNEASSKLDTQC